MYDKDLILEILEQKTKLCCRGIPRLTSPPLVGGDKGEGEEIVLIRCPALWT